MGSLGPLEIVGILLVILLLFGAKRIPEIAQGLGKGIREFKDATQDIKREMTTTPPPPQQQIQPPNAPPATYVPPTPASEPVVMQAQTPADQPVPPAIDPNAPSA